MRLNRRNVIFGLGTVVAGGGVAFGTGAFSQVEADRTITVDVTDDQNAFVSITPNTNTDLVTVDGDTGQIMIQWNADDFGGSGAHQNATIIIDKAIDFAHNGESGTTYEVSMADDNLSGDASITFTNVTEPIVLAEGETTTAGLEITTSDSSIKDETVTLEITEQ